MMAMRATAPTRATAAMAAILPTAKPTSNGAGAMHTSAVQRNDNRQPRKKMYTYHCIICLFHASAEEWRTAWRRGPSPASE